MFNYGNSNYRTKNCVICGKKFCTQSPSQTTCSPGCSIINKQKYAKKLNKLNKLYYGNTRKAKNKVAK